MSPLVGECHTKYWEFSDTNAAAVHLGRGGYPLWQASVIVPSLFGVIGAWIDTRWAQLQWHWRLLRRTHRLNDEQRAVLLYTLDTLEGPAYVRAQDAVRVTSKTLGFNRPEAWKGLSRHMKDDAGRAENTFRHLEAMRLLRIANAAAGSTLTTPQQSFVVELAYQGYALRGR